MALSRPRAVASACVGGHAFTTATGSTRKRYAVGMKLSAPKHVTWIIALVAGGLGVVSHYHIVGIGPLAVVTGSGSVGSALVLLTGVSFGAAPV